MLIHVCLLCVSQLLNFANGLLLLVAVMVCVIKDLNFEILYQIPILKKFGFCVSFDIDPKGTVSKDATGLFFMNLRFTCILKLTYHILLARYLTTSSNYTRERIWSQLCFLSFSKFWEWVLQQLPHLITSNQIVVLWRSFGICTNSSMDPRSLAMCWMSTTPIIWSPKIYLVILFFF